MNAGTKIFVSIFLFLTVVVSTFVTESITGSREPCSNEGEEVAVDSIKDMRCFKCICQNGFVECERENCPAVNDCYLLMKKTPGGCCDRCKECIYKGVHYASGKEWSDPDDPCASFKCVAGVVTESNIQCYTPCNNPLPPRPGQCCPTCLGCYLNGQNVLNGREVTLSEDPCLKCNCANKRLTCLKKACPVLQCPPSKQEKGIGECCARCNEKRELINVPGKCILGNGFHSDGKKFKPDHCSSCICRNGTSVCQRNTCPVLECPPELQKQKPGDCCPYCPLVAEVRSTCTYDGRSYQHNETWNLNPCRSCRCHNGEIRCAQAKCIKPKCKPTETILTVPGQCCAKCVESEGVCTVFGDPHYKTFDGKFYSFQGTCKYQLTADCHNHTFSIRVTNDARMTKFASWTKTVTLKIGSVKVNLGQKFRIKVNGSKIDIPYRMGSLLSITKHDDGLVLVNTEIGVRLLWDGHNYVQVQAPVSYKNKLCGLCGNYNNVWRDDLTSRRGLKMSDNEVKRFADSWRVGGIKACTRKIDNYSKQQQQYPQMCRHPKDIIHCKPLRDSQVFGICDMRLNPHNYYESCKKDMCECPSRKCYCESLAAYARECQRLGVILPSWRNETNCHTGIGHRIQQYPYQHHHQNQHQHLLQQQQQQHKHQHHQQHSQQYHHQQQQQQQQQLTQTKPIRHKNKTKKNEYSNIPNIPKTILYQNSLGRTQLPLL